MAGERERPRCPTCRFWVNQGAWDGGQDHGSCKRYPPSGHTEDDDGFGFWPWTFAADWCGEHKARAEAQP